MKQRRSFKILKKFRGVQKRGVPKPGFEVSACVKDAESPWLAGRSLGEALVL
jgi:hypothetical protein